MQPINYLGGTCDVLLLGFKRAAAWLTTPALLCVCADGGQQQRWVETPEVLSCVQTRCRFYWTPVMRSSLGSCLACVASGSKMTRSPHSTAEKTHKMTFFQFETPRLLLKWPHKQKKKHKNHFVVYICVNVVQQQSTSVALGSFLTCQLKSRSE